MVNRLAMNNVLIEVSTITKVQNMVAIVPKTNCNTLIVPTFFNIILKKARQHAR